MLGGAVTGRVLPTLSALLLLAGIGGGYVRWLRREMDLDRRTRTTSPSGRTSDGLDGLVAYSPSVRGGVLELRLILRNSKPRLSVFMAFIIAGTVAAMGYFVNDWTELRELLTGTQLLNTALWQGRFGTGGLGFLQGGNLFGWEGGFLEATMARPVSARHRTDGKLLLLGASVVVYFLIPLPVFVSTGSPAWTLHVAFALYNLGVLSCGGGRGHVQSKSPVTYGHDGLRVERLGGAYRHCGARDDSSPRPSRTASRFRRRPRPHRGAWGRLAPGASALAPRPGGSLPPKPACDGAWLSGVAGVSVTRKPWCVRRDA